MKIAKFLTFIGCVIALFLLSGCQDLINKNPEHFRNPQFAGKLTDGKSVYWIKFYNSEAGSHHYIYFVGDDITINRQSGKTRAVEVIIDGKKYKEVTE